MPVQSPCEAAGACRVACFHPITGHRTLEGKVKFSLIGGARPGGLGAVTVSCGQCWGCRLERSRQWAVRCIHEASTHERNTFLTLTYTDEHLPEGGTLDLEAFPKFVRSWRKKIYRAEKAKGRKAVKPLRYFHCGEYGEEYGRPHYHAIIFGQSFDKDKKFFKRTDNGDDLYTSEELSALWTHGHALLGEVTFESAAYVARYIMKKQSGDGSKGYYGERKPPYVTMSRNPGIGRKWYEKYGKETFRDDYIVINGKKVRPPKFYDTQFEIDNPEDMERLKKGRVDQAKKHEKNNTPERLEVREKILKRKIKVRLRDINQERGRQIK